MFLYLATYADTAILVLRVILGGLLAAHGLPKMKDLKKNAENFEQMGFKPEALFGTIVAVLEFFGGLALIIGLMAQPLAALFVIQFIAIMIWRMAKKHSFVGGWELDILILGAALLFLSIGAGAYSVDAYFNIFSGF